MVDPVAGEIVGTRSGPSPSHTSIGDPLRGDSALHFKLNTFPQNKCLVAVQVFKSCFEIPPKWTARHKGRVK